MRVIDLFCGTGGFSFGVCQGLGDQSEVVFGIDLLEMSVQTFAANHEHAKSVIGDIREWTPERVADTLGIKQRSVDLIVGGPPCQGFSSIRPNRSSMSEDERNGLYQQFVEYVDFYRPPAFIMENVVGLATHEGGKTIESISASFRKRGYTTDWRIVNAANFGVSQRRERLVMFGSRDGQEIVFPRPTHKATGDTIGYHDKSRMVTDKSTLYQRPPRRKAITAWEAISDLPPIRAGEEATEYKLVAQNDYQRKLRKGAKALTMHRATAHTEKMLEIIRHAGDNIEAIPAGLITSGFSSCYSRVDPGLPSVTLTVNFVHPASNKCIHPYQDRALTPREGARIQSFPDTYVFAGSRTQIVKQIGNAVPPILGEALGRAVKPLLKGKPMMEELEEVPATV